MWKVQELIMKQPALDGEGRFSWYKLLYDERDLVAHILDDLRSGNFGKPCARCGKRYVEVEDVEDICDSCWEIVQRAIG